MSSPAPAPSVLVRFKTVIPLIGRWRFASGLWSSLAGTAKSLRPKRLPNSRETNPSIPHCGVTSQLTKLSLALRSTSARIRMPAMKKRGFLSPLGKINSTISPLALLAIFLLLSCSLAQGILQSYLLRFDHKKDTSLNYAASWEQIGPKDYAVLESYNGLSVSICDALPHDGIACRYGTECPGLLLYPRQYLENTIRQDGSLVTIHFWLLYITLISIVYTSTRHFLVVVVARCFTTIWSSYTLASLKFHRRVVQQLLDDGPPDCSSELFSTYFNRRIHYQIGDVVLNCVSLAAILYMCWTIFRAHRFSTFQCCEAPPGVVRVSHFFTVLQATLLLSEICLLVTAALWIDRLANTWVGELVYGAHTVFKVFFIGTLVVVIPWNIAGWNGIRRERNVETAILLLVGLLFIAGWSIVLSNPALQMGFTLWPFLGTLTIISFVLTVTIVILGVVGRISFGKGLAECLHAEEMLKSSDLSPASMLTPLVPEILLSFLSLNLILLRFFLSKTRVGTAMLPYITPKKTARSGAVPIFPVLDEDLEDGRSTFSRTSGETLVPFDLGAGDGYGGVDSKDPIMLMYQDPESLPLTPTNRQSVIRERALGINDQIAALQHEVSSSKSQVSEAAVEIQRLRSQIRHLLRDQDSDWARGLTDDLPPSYVEEFGEEGRWVS